MTGPKLCTSLVSGERRSSLPTAMPTCARLTCALRSMREHGGLWCRPCTTRAASSSPSCGMLAGEQHDCMIACILLTTACLAHWAAVQGVACCVPARWRIASQPFTDSCASRLSGDLPAYMHDQPIAHGCHRQARSGTPSADMPPCRHTQARETWTIPPQESYRRTSCLASCRITSTPPSWHALQDLMVRPW